MDHFYAWIRARLGVCRLAVPLALLLLTCGCSSFSNYNSTAADFYHPYREGNLGKAASSVTSAANSEGAGKSGLLLNLERGAVLRSAGMHAESLRAFENAEARVEAYDNRAVISARDYGGGAVATLTNDNNLPYKGFAYDRIMLNTYKALDYLELGQPEGAMVELRRAYSRQQEAVERFRKEIESAQSAAASNGVNYDSLGGNVGRSEGAPDMSRYAAYTDFVNPFTVWLDGVVFLHAGSGNSDMERARQDFSRLRGMIGDSPMLAADAALVDARFRNERVEPLVYVVLENGMAPVRMEERMDLPLPIHNQLTYVGVALPRLAYQRTPLRGMGVVSGDGRRLGSTELVCNMDAVVTREFELRLPMIMTRALAGTAIRTAGQAVLTNQFRQEMGDGAALAASLGMAALSYGVTKADLRTWQTLPKEFQVARVPRPASGELRLTGLASDILVTLPDAEVALVYVRTANPGLMQVRTSVLR